MPSQRRQRRQSRIYRRYNRDRLSASINNGDTLRRIANLPQQITTDLLMIQFFGLR
uniref:Uncharacterized protein n=1 Tax=Rhizophagus irregularis (strain DAOM 181602 / DAOM 197198 / MUCL 43194) TaxID=747089 RepID=U9SGB9_RHIID